MMKIPLIPGPKNTLCDIAGLRVGHAHDGAVKSGVTVVLPDQPVTMAVDVRGGGPGTRETDALNPSCLVQKVHGLVLSGGSVFGLAAADAVTQWLSDQGAGLPISPRPVPVVPAAVLFDLKNGGEKKWQTSPYATLAIHACENASANMDQGSVGAGHGAQFGAWPGAIGSASLCTQEGIMVAALVAVNAFGGPTGLVTGHEEIENGLELPKEGLVGTNTSLGVVATNLALDKAQAQRLAMMAQDGLARAIRPIHTPFDGDTIFAMAMGTQIISSQDLPRTLAIAGTMAADCVVNAVTAAFNAVR